uniref:Uncharacterized protein n=1 Tax=Cucumis melo TaxID=3656 RepID=A0A9I9EB62_CUCME
MLFNQRRDRGSPDAILKRVESSLLLTRFIPASGLRNSQRRFMVSLSVFPPLLMLTALSLPQSWTIDSVVRPVHLPQRRLLFFPLTLCIPHGVSLIQSFDFQLRKSNSKRSSFLISHIQGLGFS